MKINVFKVLGKGYLVKNDTQNQKKTIVFNFCFQEE